MQTIVYQCDTAMPAQKLPNCCNKHTFIISPDIYKNHRTAENRKPCDMVMKRIAK